MCEVFSKDLIDKKETYLILFTLGVRYNGLNSVAVRCIVRLLAQRSKVHRSSTIKLLIVEDEADIAEIMAEVLSEDIQDIRIAKDGVEALEKLEESPDINCVITDINMPRMDGITLCQKLRTSSPGIPVLIVTAEASHEQKARAAGAVDVLIKPFMMEEFRSWVLEKMAIEQPVDKN